MTVTVVKEVKKKVEVLVEGSAYAKSVSVNVESVETVVAVLVIVCVVTMSVEEEIVTVGLVVVETAEDFVKVVVVETTSGVTVDVALLVGAVNRVLEVTVCVTVV